MTTSITARRVARKKIATFGLVVLVIATSLAGVLIGTGLVKVSNINPSENAIEMKQASLWFWHDPQRNVGCWMNEDGGLACLPDSSYTKTTRVNSDIPVVIKSGAQEILNREKKP